MSTQLDLVVERRLEDVSDGHDGSILLTTVWINSSAHHFNAIRIKEDGFFDGTDENGQAMLDDFYGAYEGGPWVTTEIPGYEGQYIIVIHPHGD